MSGPPNGSVIVMPRRNGPLRLLWVKVGGLWPPNAGGRLRSLHLLRELSRRHSVTVLTTHGPAEDPKVLREQLPRCDVWSAPFAAPKHGSGAFLRALVRSWWSPLPLDLCRWRVPALTAELRARAAQRQADLYIVDFLVSAANLPARLPLPLVLFEHNVEHQIWRRLACVERRPWRRAALELEWRKLRRYEAHACRSAPLTLAVSDADAQALRGLAPGAAVRAIPTGVDTDYFTPAVAREVPGRLVFTGSMDWYPNEEAMLHFLGRVFPRIREAAPETTLAIVGRKPSARLSRAAALAGARVTGTVQDVRPYVREASVFVVPLRVGGGTRLKIFEALAMGKAVVSTRIGAEGLPLVPGHHYLRADDDADFARAVLALLADPGQRRALGSAGRSLVEERYSWREVARVFEERCLETLPTFRAAAECAGPRVLRRNEWPSFQRRGPLRESGG
jgi:sugar transferase (PEP-CTERM/EpsH1 system associated)